MDLTKFKLCAGCSTEDLEIYHHEDDGRTAYRRKRIDGYMGPLIEGEPPGVVRGAPRVNVSGLLALLAAGLASANTVRDAAGKESVKATEPEIRSLTDVVDRMKRERLATLRLSPEEAAQISDAPEGARSRGVILSRYGIDGMTPPGDLQSFVFTKGDVFSVFLPFEPEPEAAKDPEPAPAPAAPAAGPNPPPLKSLGLHLCPDGGVVVTEWPEGAGLPPCLYASASAGHAVGYALTALKAGRKAIREEAKAAGQEEPPVRPVVMNVDLAGGPDRVGTFTMQASGLTVPGLRINR